MSKHMNIIWNNNSTLNFKKRMIMIMIMIRKRLRSWKHKRKLKKLSSALRTFLKQLETIIERDVIKKKLTIYNLYFLREPKHSLQKIQIKLESKYLINSITLNS